MSPLTHLLDGNVRYYRWIMAANHRYLIIENVLFVCLWGGQQGYWLTLAQKIGLFDVSEWNFMHFEDRFDVWLSPHVPNFMGRTWSLVFVVWWIDLLTGNHPCFFLYGIASHCLLWLGLLSGWNFSLEVWEFKWLFLSLRRRATLTDFSQLHNPILCWLNQSIKPVDEALLGDG